MKEELTPAGKLKKGESEKQRRLNRRERGVVQGRSETGGYRVTVGNAIGDGRSQASVKLQEYGAGDVIGKKSEVHDNLGPRVEMYILPEDPVVGGYVVSTLADSLGSMSISELEELCDGTRPGKE
jgi:hypothetical protein